MNNKAIAVDSIMTLALILAFKVNNIDAIFKDGTDNLSNAERLAKSIETKYICHSCYYPGYTNIFCDTCATCGSDHIQMDTFLNSEQQQVVLDVTKLYKGEEIVNKEFFEKLDIKHIGVLIEFFQNKVTLDFVTKVING